MCRTQSDCEHGQRGTKERKVAAIPHSTTQGPNSCRKPANIPALAPAYMHKQPVGPGDQHHLPTAAYPASCPTITRLIDAATTSFQSRVADHPIYHPIIIHQSSPAMVPPSSSSFLASSRTPPIRSAFSTGSMRKAGWSTDSWACWWEAHDTQHTCMRLQTLAPADRWVWEAALTPCNSQQHTLGGSKAPPPTYNSITAGCKYTH